MNFIQHIFYAAHRSYAQRFALLLFILLIGIVDGDAQATGTVKNHEYADRKHDAEPRQFGGFNANAAFNSNFGSSNFGLNFGSSTTSLPFNIPQYSTTKSPNSNNLNTFDKTNKKEPNKNVYNDYNQKYPGTHIVDRYNHRYPDGSYEYRFELSDGTARYERGYFLLYDNKKTLVVVGYYSYRMPDGRYLTVFYNADQNGYRQNQSITPQSFPNLPRSIEVPQYKSKDTDNDYPSISSSTPNPRLTTTTTKRHGGRF